MVASNTEHVQNKKCKTLTAPQTGKRNILPAAAPSLIGLPQFKHCLHYHVVISGLYNDTTGTGKTLNEMENDHELRANKHLCQNGQQHQQRPEPGTS
jgi:hypothetical protein